MHDQTPNPSALSEALTLAVLVGDGPNKIPMEEHLRRIGPGTERVPALTADQVRERIALWDQYATQRGLPLARDLDSRDARTMDLWTEVEEAASDYLAALLARDPRWS